MGLRRERGLYLQLGFAQGSRYDLVRFPVSVITANASAYYIRAMIREKIFSDPMDKPLVEGKTRLAIPQNLIESVKGKKLITLDYVRIEWHR